MLFEFQRVDPKKVRDDVVNFFWEQHHSWPGRTLDDYYDIWDWRYTALSDGVPLVYVARLRETRELIGHIAVYRRNFRFGDVNFVIGVPGDLMVHPQWQHNVVSTRLVMFLRSLVQSGEVDAIIGFGNHLANAMVVRLGFAALGAMHTYIDLRDAEPLLRRRHRALVVLAPILNLVLSARRRLRSLPDSRQHSRFRVSQLTSDEFLKLDRSHWARPTRLVASDSNSFVVQRYLTWPRGHDARRYVYGLFDPTTGLLEAYVVAEIAARVKVWDCQVNSAIVDAPSAIAAIAAIWPRTGTVLVPTLPQSLLAAEMVRAGFFDRESQDFADANTYVSVYCQRGGPHADLLSNPRSWNLWLGTRHY